MKSPEKMGSSPEQPKEELVKDKEKIPEKPTSPESYNEAEWEKLKQNGAAFALNKGRRIGVPQEELDRFAQDVITLETESQNYGLVYRFRKNMGIGTEEDIKIAGEQAYKFFLESGDSNSAMGVAEDVYGRGSDEWQRAHETNKVEREKTEKKRKRKEEKMEDEEQELDATISRDATFADLFNVIDAIEEEEGLGKLHFEEELWDNFDSEIAEAVLAFRNVQADRAATTKVLDFFKERGYPQNDVSVFLPIKFKRERKKKK